MLDLTHYITCANIYFMSLFRHKRPHNSENTVPVHKQRNVRAENLCIDALQRSVRAHYDSAKDSNHYISVIPNADMPPGNRAEIRNRLGTVASSYFRGLGPNGLEYDPRTTNMDRHLIANIDPELGDAIAKAEEHGQLQPDDVVMVFRPGNPKEPQ